MRFPNWLITALLMAAVAFLQYILNHVADLHLSEVYAPLIVAVLSWGIKALQERAEPPATRGLSETSSFWQRVLFK